MPFVSPVTVQLVAGTLKVQDLELSLAQVRDSALVQAREPVREQLAFWDQTWQ